VSPLLMRRVEVIVRINRGPLSPRPTTGKRACAQARPKASLPNPRKPGKAWQCNSEALDRPCETACRARHCRLRRARSGAYIQAAGSIIGVHFIEPDFHGSTRRIGRSCSSLSDQSRDRRRVLPSDDAPGRTGSLFEGLRCAAGSGRKLRSCRDPWSLRPSLPLEI